MFSPGGFSSSPGCLPGVATGKLHVEPRAICEHSGLGSVTECHWDEELIKSFLKDFEINFLMRITDPMYWHRHPWNGLFDGIRNRLFYNCENTRKKRWSYWEMMRRNNGNLLSAQHPSVPTLIWGRADHSLSFARLDAELMDPDSQWWPGLVNPWVAAGADGCSRWVLCADNAVTGSRPWEVHMSRIFVITDDLAGMPPMAAPVTPQPAPTDPFTTSSVEIDEIASDSSSDSSSAEFFTTFSVGIASDSEVASMVAANTEMALQWIVDHHSNVDASDVASVASSIQMEQHYMPLSSPGTSIPTSVSSLADTIASHSASSSVHGQSSSSSTHLLNNWELIN